MKKDSSVVGNLQAYIKFSDTIRAFYDAKHEDIEKMGLKTTHARMIHFILDFQGLSQQELCEVFSLSPSTMSETLTEMERLDLIKRERNEQNRRMVSVGLTKNGNRIALTIYDLFEDYCNTFLTSFTQDEVAEFERLLTKFNS